MQLLDATARPYDFAVSGDPRTYAELATPAGLRFVADLRRRASGPSKDYIVPRDAAGSSLPPTTLRRPTRTARGLAGPPVHVPAREHVPAARAALVDRPRRVSANLEAEMRQFFALGVDGLFTDNPDIGGRRARIEASSRASRR